MWRVAGLCAMLIAVASMNASAEVRTIAFSCSDGAPLEVTFAADPSGPAVVRRSSDVPVTLPAQPTGSGYRYGDGAHELRGRGQVVTWTDRTGQRLSCSAT
jgi:membrane-bound inhibitor of C-type lysozyme